MYYKNKRLYAMFYLNKHSYYNKITEIRMIFRIIIILSVIVNSSAYAQEESSEEIPFPDLLDFENIDEDFSFDDIELPELNDAEEVFPEDSSSQPAKANQLQIEVDTQPLTKENIVESEVSINNLSEDNIEKNEREIDNLLDPIVEESTQENINIDIANSGQDNNDEILGQINSEAKLDDNSQIEDDNVAQVIVDESVNKEDDAKKIEELKKNLQLFLSGITLEELMEKQALIKSSQEAEKDTPKEEYSDNEEASDLNQVAEIDDNSDKKDITEDLNLLSVESENEIANKTVEVAPSEPVANIAKANEKKMPSNLEKKPVLDKNVVNNQKLNKPKEDLKKIENVQQQVPKKKPAPLAKRLEKSPPIKTTSKSKPKPQPQLKPIDSDSLLYRAYKALMADQAIAAISIYKEVLAVDPNSFDALFGVGSAYQRIHQYNNAFEFYIKAIKQNPKDADGIINILMVSEYIPEDIQKKGFLELAKSLGKELPAKIASATSLLYLKDGDFRLALPFLEQAVSKSPDNLLDQYHLAISYDHLKQYESAIKHYRIVVYRANNGVAFSEPIDPIKLRLKQLTSLP